MTYVKRAYTTANNAHAVISTTMKVTIKRWNAVAQWRWDTRSTNNNNNDNNNDSSEPHQPQETIIIINNKDDDSEDDLCGICRVAFEACCPSCKTPGDDCPLSVYFIYSLILLTIGFYMQSGANAHTSSICTAYSNGSEQQRQRVNVPWTEENGVHFLPLLASPSDS